MLLHFLQKETFVICYFPSTQWKKEATLDAWKQTAILQIHCGISPLPSISGIPGRRVRNGRFGRNVLRMSDWPRLELPWLVLGRQCDFDIFYSTVWVKTFREENNLLTSGLLTRRVNCGCRPPRRKPEMTRYKTDSIYICSNYPKGQTTWRDQVWQKHIKCS